MRHACEGMEGKTFTCFLMLSFEVAVFINRYLPLADINGMFDHNFVVLSFRMFLCLRESFRTCFLARTGRALTMEC